MQSVENEVLSELDGVYPDLSDNEYHGGPGLSSTNVKTFMKSPAHYRHYEKHDRADTSAMFFGRLVHGLALEPDKITERLHVVEASTKTTKLYKNAVTENPHKMVVLQKELQQATDIAAVVRNHPLVRNNPRFGDLLDASLNEASLYWTDQNTLCKSRMDIWNPSKRIIADLKTTTDASPQAFQRDVIKYKYDVSAAWYRRGVLEITEEDILAWLWIAVEKEPPYALQVYEADPALIALADAKCSEALRDLRRCRDTDHWPGYADETLTISAPAWAL